MFDKAEITIGTTFLSRGKYPKTCKVIDIYKTYNVSGNLIKTSYVATHELAGQIITETDISAATIIRGMEK